MAGQEKLQSCNGKKTWDETI